MAKNIACHICRKPKALDSARPVRRVRASRVPVLASRQSNLSDKGLRRLYFVANTRDARTRRASCALPLTENFRSGS